MLQLGDVARDMGVVAEATEEQQSGEVVLQADLLSTDTDTETQENELQGLLDFQPLPFDYASSSMYREIEVDEDYEGLFSEIFGVMDI